MEGQQMLWEMLMGDLRHKQATLPGAALPDGLSHHLPPNYQHQLHPHPPLLVSLPLSMVSLPSLLPSASTPLQVSTLGDMTPKHLCCPLPDDGSSWANPVSNLDGDPLIPGPEVSDIKALF